MTGARCGACQVLAREVLHRACLRAGAGDCDAIRSKGDIQAIARRIIATINAHPDADGSRQAAGLLRRFIDVYKGEAEDSGR